MRLLAQTVSNVFGEVVPPSPVAAIGNGAKGINQVLYTGITLLYTISAVAFVFMFLISALQWIVSAGEKDKVSAAKKRMTWAVIGLTTLSLTYVFLRIFGRIVGFKLYGF
jgi:hypothetical protein